jgi:hypothetical protein
MSSRRCLFIDGGLGHEPRRHECVIYIFTFVVDDVDVILEFVSHCRIPLLRIASSPYRPVDYNLLDL